MCRRYQSILLHTIKNLDTCVKRVNDDLVAVKSWSSNANLIFNSTKTKILPFSSKQMSRFHNLHGNLHVWKPDDFSLESVSSYKVLGVTITEDLS